METAGGVELRRAADPDKDQSYVLYTLSREAVERSLFPVGDLVKAEVRAIAARTIWPWRRSPTAPTSARAGGDYREFVRRFVPDRPGPIRDRDGAILGQHRGVQHFTVGQRRGLGVTTGAPVFVTSIDAATNTVHLGREDDLLTQAFAVGDCHWLIEPPRSLDVGVKVRYGSETTPGVVVVGAEGEAKVTLARPARAVAPGQAAVFYQGDRVLGGGTIARSQSGLGSVV